MQANEHRGDVQEYLLSLRNTEKNNWSEKLTLIVLIY